MTSSKLAHCPELLATAGSAQPVNANSRVSHQRCSLRWLCNVCDSEMQSQCSLWTGSLQRKREVSIALDRPNDNPSGFEKPKICALMNQTWAEMEVSCLTKFSSFGWNYFIFLVSAGRDCNFECKPSQSVVTLNPTVANCYWWVGVNMDVGSMPLVEL